MQPASDSSVADPSAPPNVRVVIATRNPGPWFDDVVNALAEQDYPALSVTIVHAGEDGPLLERHHEKLSSLELVEMPPETGFGPKVNAVAETATEPLLLVHHDDVAMGPSTVSALVREWLRRKEPRTLVGAKLLDWTDEQRLMPAGFDADRFGETRPIVSPGDLDQGQQDRVVDIFGTSTACLLLDRQFFLDIGGFDPEMDWHGEAFDIALRTRSVGGQVVIPAAATARHRGVFEQRGGLSGALRQRRHSMRSVLAAAPASSLPFLLLAQALLSLLEFVVALARFDIVDAASVPGAWLWNVSKIGSLLSRRKTLTAIDTFSGDELRLIRRRGSLRLSESVDRRVSQREIATETGEATVSAIRVAGGLSIGAILAFGARHLLTRDIPAVGEFRMTPDDVGTLTSDWWSGLRVWGMGSEGFASFALPLLDLLGLATLGSASLLRIALIVLPIPIGVMGVWKLFGRSSSEYAPVAAALLYAASPLPYNAIAGGSWKSLVLYALLPWMLGNMASATQTTTFGPIRSRWAATAALGALVSVAVAVSPSLLLLVALITLGILVGSLLSGDMRGVVPLLGVVVGSLAVAVVVNAPALSSISSWSQFAGAQTPQVRATPLTELLTLDTGPIGSSYLGWAVFAPALLPLISGAGERFSWAMRIWGVMLIAWTVAWTNARGWLPVGLPVDEVLLAVIPLGFAVLAGLGALILDTDLAGARVRRMFPVAIAVIGFTIAVVPLLDATSTGRWELSRVDLTTTYGALDSAPEDGTYRVLWIGDAHVLGAAAIPTANDLAWMTSLDGVPDIRALWGGPDEGATAALSEVVEAGLDGRTSRLGRQLSPFGVRYIVIMDQQAPVPEVSRRELVSDIRAAELNGQLDLVRDGVVNPAVSVYRNTAWVPVNAAVAPGDLDRLQLVNADPAVVIRSAYDQFDGQTRLERNVYSAWEPSPRWVLTVDGAVAPRLDTDLPGMSFETSNANSTEASLIYTTSDRHRIVVVMQALAWFLLFAGRRWLVGEPRRRRRAAGHAEVAR